MNIRAFLHVLSEVLQSVSMGTVAFSGIDTETSQLIFAVCGLASIAVTRYLTLTTSGSARS